MIPAQATTYIGLCRFERAYDENGNSIAAAEGQVLETFEAPIACWSTSAQQYDEMLAHLLPDQSYRLLRTEEVMPAQTWFEMKGFNQPLADLTAKVHDQHRFEIGTLRSVAFEQTHGVEGAVNPENDQSPLIITEHPITPLPDQGKIWPPSERQWISNDLKGLLFGQTLPKEHQHILNEDTDNPVQNVKQPLIRTYFIADATLRTKITKVFDLDMDFPKRPAGADWIDGDNGNRGNIKYRSLFKGEAQEELKEVAPYLIDMTLPERAYEDATYVPDFQKSFFQGTWDEALKNDSEGITHLDTGIFIRTTQDFDAVWRHFRKFTRVQGEEKWYYWRFWDTLTAELICLNLSQNLTQSLVSNFLILIIQPFDSAINVTRNPNHRIGAKSVGSFDDFLSALSSAKISFLIKTEIKKFMCKNQMALPKNDIEKIYAKIRSKEGIARAKIKDLKTFVKEEVYAHE